MPLFRVWTRELKEVEMSYDVEASDEDEAADLIAALRGLDDAAAERYLAEQRIESNLEAHEDAADELHLEGVDLLRRSR